MIEFHGDKLVPPELCSLLGQVVPERYHVPVTFTNNRRHPLAHAGRWGFPLGSCCPEYIVVNLSPIYGEAMNHRVGSGASRVWIETLRVCLHEFGHLATQKRCGYVSAAEYGNQERGYRRSEHLADQWAHTRMLELAEHDSRLGQPDKIGGYLGARLSRRYSSLKLSSALYGGSGYGGSGKAAYIRELRCLRTGAQFAAGDVIKMLALYGYKNRYAALRRASDGLGIDYVDAAGRHHKLYRWGDLPQLAERLTAALINWSV